MGQSCHAVNTSTTAVAPDDRNENSYPAFALDFAKLCRILAGEHSSSGDAEDQVELGIMLFVLPQQTSPFGARKRIEFVRRRDAAPRWPCAEQYTPGYPVTRRTRRAG